MHIVSFQNCPSKSYLGPQFFVSIKAEKWHRSNFSQNVVLRDAQLIHEAVACPQEAEAPDQEHLTEGRSSPRDFLS